MRMTFGSLFAGIGGMDLGLERAGMECRWQVEIDPFCRKVLEKHWPEVPKYGDIRELDGSELEPVDLIAGGFPCQDVSVANTGPSGGSGIRGARSGLWSEYKRIVRQTRSRPRFVLIENSPALAIRGLDGVLCDLAELGMDAVWLPLQARFFGAVHKRERLFIVAHSDSDGLQGRFVQQLQQAVESIEALDNRRHWPTVSEPFGAGSHHGIPDRVDRTKALGNAVVPQVAEWIGRRIVEVEREARESKG